MLPILEDRSEGLAGAEEAGLEDRSEGLVGSAVEVDAGNPDEDADEEVAGDRSEEFVRVEVVAAEPGTGFPAPRIYFADNLEVLPRLADASFELIYVDPPFNTGRTQVRTQMKMVPDADGDRTGFSGRRYRTIKLGTRAYADVFDDYLGFLWPRLEHAHRLAGLFPDATVEVIDDSGPFVTEDQPAAVARAIRHFVTTRVEPHDKGIDLREPRVVGEHYFRRKSPLGERSYGRIFRQDVPRDLRQSR